MMICTAEKPVSRGVSTQHRRGRATYEVDVVLLGVDGGAREGGLVGGPQLIAEEGGGVEHGVADLETRLGRVAAGAGDDHAALAALLVADGDAQGLVNGDLSGTAQ
jgi:hypothetical protein